MSRQLPGTRYQAKSCDGVICSGIVNVFLASDRLSPIWHSSVIIPCLDFMAVTAVGQWEPYLSEVSLIPACRLLCGWCHECWDWAKLTSHAIIFRYLADGVGACLEFLNRDGQP
jgi:hypothetical protein